MAIDKRTGQVSMISDTKPRVDENCFELRQHTFTKNQKEALTRNDILKWENARLKTEKNDFVKNTESKDTLKQLRKDLDKATSTEEVRDLVKQVLDTIL